MPTAFSISGSPASQSSKSCGRTSPPSGNKIPIIFHSSIVVVRAVNLPDKLSIIASTSVVKSALFFSNKRSAKSPSNGRISFSIRKRLFRVASALACNEERWSNASLIFIFRALEASIPSRLNKSIISPTTSLLLSSSLSIFSSIEVIRDSLLTSSNRISKG